MSDNTPKTPRRALVVIDVQNEYFDGGLRIDYPPTAESLPNIARAMDAAKAAGIPIAVVQHCAPAGAPIFDPGSHGWQLHPEVARRPFDHRIEKRFPSVFARTDFAEWLEKLGVDTLSVVGYMTHNCDAATVYEASHRGLTVEWLSDASGALPYANDAGAASGEEIHRVYSVVFQTGFAAVAKTDAWLVAVKEGQALPKDGVYGSHRRAVS